MKYCCHCSAAKFFEPSIRNGTKARGFYGTRCWDCYCKHSAALKVLQYTKEEKAVISARHYAKVVSPEYLATENERSKLWACENPDKANVKSAKRRVGRTQRVPLWADLAKIKAVYAEAFAAGLTVDHIIPLHGKLISGLHVHTNLQLLPRSENCSKGNTYAQI